MRQQLCAAMAVAACLMALAVGRSSAQQVDSSLFQFQYNGDTYPVVTGHTESPGAGTWAPSSDGSVLSWKQVIEEGGHWDNDDWAANINNASGWTIEFRVRIGDDGPDDPGFGAMQVFAKDGSGTNSQFRRAAIAVGQNATYIGSRGFAVTDTQDNTDDFHVFRYGQLPNSSSMMLWRDGVLLFEGLSATSNASGGPNMWWGDGSSAIGGPTVELDYLRWEPTGLYEPVGWKHGDLNGDTEVNLADFEVFKSDWLTSGFGRSDLNNNGFVDLADFVLFKQLYEAENPGGGGSLAMPVPEPAAWALVAAALPAWVFLRRRRAAGSK